MWRDESVGRGVEKLLRAIYRRRELLAVCSRRLLSALFVSQIVKLCRVYLSSGCPDHLMVGGWRGGGWGEGERSGGAIRGLDHRCSHLVVIQVIG